MKTLLESLLDNKKDITGDLVEEQIREWLENNCKIIRGNYKIFIKNNKYYVDVDGDIKIIDINIERFPIELFQFNYIDGNFDCSYCENLKSLEGCPKEIKGSFTCMRCESLTSLKGVPEKIEKNFDCSLCSNLTSLKGAPKEVGGMFDCSNCKSLKTLEGAPKKVGGRFECTNCYKLSSFKGLSPIIGRDLYMANCDKLINKYQDIESEIRDCSSINGEVVLSEEGY